MLSREAVNRWRPRLQALDPWRPIGLEEISVLYAERPDLRSQRIAESLLTAADPADVKVMFCGARGSGKTTELTNIGHLLGKDFATVHVNTLAAIEEGPATAAIVALLGVAGLRACALWSDPNAGLEWPPAGGLKTLSEQLEQALKLFGVGSGVLGEWVQGAGAVVALLRPDAGVAVAAAGGALQGTGTLAAKAAEGLVRLREIGRGALGGALDRAQGGGKAEGLVSAVQAIFDELGELAGRPPLLLVDGLDQLDSIDDVMAAVSDAELLRELRVPIVFTGPVQLRHHEQFSGLPGRFRPEVLHNLPVVTHGNDGGVADGPGIDVLVAAYQGRAKHLSLPADLCSEAVLRRAARLSSGIVRDFFHLLDLAGKEAMRGGRDQISSRDLEGAERAKRQLLQLALNETRIELLRRVLDREVLPAGPESEKLLFENYLACYPNDNLWYRPHEVLVEYLSTLRSLTSKA